MSIIAKVLRKSREQHIALQLNRPRFRRQRGASAIEYVVIAAVIVVAIFLGASMTGLGAAVQGVFDSITEGLSS